MSSKSLRKALSSHSSQSPSQNTPPVHPSPATHKRNAELFLNSPFSSPMLSHLVNDDQSEKKRRLQARISDAAHLGSPATSKRTASNVDGWNASQITEHLHNCIQLSRDNKITARNAFSLHLIDTMKDMIRKEKEPDFQMAGSSIEAGAKIYASRVDALHLQAIQVLDQVSQLDKDGGKGSSNNQFDDDGAQGDDPTTKRNPVKRKKKILETDLRKINVSSVEQTHEVDPLLQKLSKEGDSSFGGLLLDSLRCSYDVPALMLDMQCSTEVPEGFKLQNTQITDNGIPWPSLSTQVICPTFHKFDCGGGAQHPIFDALDCRDDELKYNPDKDISQHEADGADFADTSFGDDQPNDMDVIDNEGGNSQMDYISKTANSHGGTTTVATDGTFSSLVSLVTEGAGDYTFFGNMKNMWAGPAYWKVKRLNILGSKRPGEDMSNLNGIKKTAAKKKQLVINFDDEIDFRKHFKKTRAAISVSKQTLERYKKQSLNLPEDLNYQSKDFLRLLTRRKVYVTLQKATNPVDPDDVINKSAVDYDYYNKNDTDNFCPNISGVSGEDNDFEHVSVMSTQPPVLDLDDSLIAQPNLVARINLQYAKRPKKVDFKRVKRNMWGLITEPMSNKENVDGNVETTQVCVKSGGVSFHQMYQKLPDLSPLYEARDLSPPIAFVALLHMCNEKNLMLKATESFTDVEIYAGDD